MFGLLMPSCVKNNNASQVCKIFNSSGSIETFMEDYQCIRQCITKKKRFISAQRHFVDNF